MPKGNLWFATVEHVAVPGTQVCAIYTRSGREPSDRAIKAALRQQGVRPKDMVVTGCYDMNWAGEKTIGTKQAIADYAQDHLQQFITWR